MKFLLSLLLALHGLCAWADDASAPVRTEQTTTRLVAHAPEGIAPGKPLQLGLLIEHAPHWHTYWKNPGDSGLPTRLSWTLPAGLQASDIAWPAPHKLPVGPMVNYGFEGELLLPVRITLPATLPAGPLRVQLQAEWLVCKELCIPESGQYQLELPQGQSLAAQGARFERALAQQPAALAAAVEAKVEGEQLVLSIPGLPATWRGQAVQLLAEQAGVIDHAAVETLQWSGERLQLRLPLSPQRSESPAQMQAVLRAGEATARIDFAVTGGWGGSAMAAAAPTPALQPAAPAPSQNPGLLLALLLAFAGGLLLNLMPCVFPVLSLKALALVNEAPAQRRVGALAYTAGVVLSFVALAGALLALRAAGSGVGWGFQLQQPLVVAGLALLFTVIALNLFGIFEFGTFAPSSAGGWRARQPGLDQFLTGVLSVAIASPCTAPFMGAALGAAIAMPAPQALLVFAFLGLGLAAPYALVAWMPQLARHLPRPGAWMAKLRTLLAFPMLATVLWLTWVLGMQRGLSAAVSLLVLLLSISLALWAWVQRGAAWRVLAGLSLLAGGLWAAPTLHTPDGLPSQSPALGDWQAWTPDAQAKALASGRPVFVDFTAAWCITCQFNKRGALADAQVLADFKVKNVQLLRADWTLRDAVISAELTQLGRSGVPVYALHRPASSAAPLLLPEILSPSGVREALATLP